MVHNDMNIFLIFLSAMLVNNVILIRFLSLCPFFGVSNKIDTSIGMGMAVLFVMVNASMVTWLIFNFLLVPFDLQYLRTVAFVASLFGMFDIASVLFSAWSQPPAP